MAPCKRVGNVKSTDKKHRLLKWLSSQVNDVKTIFAWISMYHATYVTLHWDLILGKNPRQPEFRYFPATKFLRIKLYSKRNTLRFLCILRLNIAVPSKKKYWWDKSWKKIFQIDESTVISIWRILMLIFLKSVKLLTHQLVFSTI